MDFWHVTKLLFRRWYIAVPLLLITAAAGAYVATTVKPDNVVTSYIQLVPPQTDSDQLNGRPINPWNSLGLSALNQAASLSTQDQTFVESLKAKGLSDQFTIELGYPSPVATIEVTANSQDGAYRTTQAVVEQFQSAVLSLQTKYNVSPQDLISTQRLDRGENLKIETGKVKRALVLVVGSGVLLSLALVIGIDALSRRRKKATSVDDFDPPTVQPRASDAHPGLNVNPPRMAPSVLLSPTTESPAPVYTVPPPSLNPVQVSYRRSGATGSSFDSTSEIRTTPVADDAADHDRVSSAETTLLLPPLGGGMRSNGGRQR